MLDFASISIIYDFFSFSLSRPFDTDGEQQTPGGTQHLAMPLFYHLFDANHKCKLVFLRGVTETGI